MGLQQERERLRLRSERDRLYRQIATLVGERVRTDGAESPDDYVAAVQRHREEYRVFRDALKAFHRQYGPLGP